MSTSVQRAAGASKAPMFARSPGCARADRPRAKRLGGAWLLGLLIWVPLALGAKGCDPVAPGAPCGGLAGALCDEGEYCNYPESARCGAADATGTCAPFATVCSDLYDPVCGCDQQTYTNDCQAARSGASVAHRGACVPAPSPTCGGVAGLTCPAGSYCNYPPEAACGASDASGICTPISATCTDALAQVCGCDGRTYANPCLAAQAGVSIAANGACAAAAAANACGAGIAACNAETNASGTCGSGLPACPAGSYCAFSLDTACGAAGDNGTCAPIPEACDFGYDPVCGCDGQTYGNACLAAAAAISVAAARACP